MEDILQKRHSVRRFKETEIPNVEEILHLARKAPTAGGLRAYKPYPVIDREIIEKIAGIARQGWIAKASLIIVLCTWPEKSKKRYGGKGNLYSIQDTTLYGLYLDLIFVSRGYGTCWVGSFKATEISILLKIPREHFPISLLVVGKEDDG